MVESHPHGMSSSPIRQAKMIDAQAARTYLDQLIRSSKLEPIVHALAKAGDLHLVGGTVRDALLGLKQCDLDLATVLPPTEAKTILAQHGIHVVETGLQHGTITAVIEGNNIEITTFRNPGVTPTKPYTTSIGEDLAGRDFTINAIAYSLTTRALVDPFSGITDLQNQILRTPGKAKERFMEDPLRILRMIRFGPAEGRSVADDVLSSAQSLVLSLNDVSPERIRVELVKILLAPFAAQALRDMERWGILKIILPEAIASVGFEQNEFHIHDVFEHTLWVIERCPSEENLRLSALFHDLGKPASLSVDEQGLRHFYKHEEISEKISKTVMKRLKFSNDVIDAVSTVVRHHMRPLDCGPAGVRRLIRDLGQYFSEWRTFKVADAPPKVDPAEIQKLLTRFDAMVEEERKRQKGSVYGKLAVNGNDLMELGMKPGVAMGNLLKKLEEKVIENPEMNDREALLKEAKKLLSDLHQT